MLGHTLTNKIDEVLAEWLERARAEERERCAKIAESMMSKDTDWDNSNWNQCAERIALKIRSTP